MSVKRSIIVLDTETTGLDPRLGCEVIQIAATAINYWDLSDHHAGTFHQLITPQRPEKAQKGAIDKTGDLFARAQKEGIHPKVVWASFKSWCETVNDGKSAMTKPIVMAFNLPFDSRFIRSGMEEYGVLDNDKLGLPEMPWSFEFDALTLAYSLFESDFNTNDLKLDTMLSKLGMARDTDKHDALEDVKLLAEWVKRAMTFYRTCAKKMRLPSQLPKGKVTV